MTLVERIRACIPGQLVAVIFDRDFDRTPRKPAPLVGDQWNAKAFEPIARYAESLGATERDAEWKSVSTGARWRWADEQWWFSRGGSFFTPSQLKYIGESRGPFMEIVVTEMDWLGWAVPAIMTELDLHFYTPDRIGSGVRCRCEYHATSLGDWLDHVAPLIAKRIGCDPKRAAQALQRYRPDKV